MENKSYSSFYEDNILNMFLSKKEELFPLHYYLCKTVSEKKTVLDFFESIPDEIVEKYLDACQDFDFFSIEDEAVSSDLLVTVTALNLLEACKEKGIHQDSIRKRVGYLLTGLASESIVRKVRKGMGIELFKVTLNPKDPWNLGKISQQLNPDYHFEIEESNGK